MAHLRLSLVLSAIAVSAFSSAQTFNLTNDFSITNGNPNGVWTYGSVAGTTFTPLTSTGNFALGPYWTNAQSITVWRNSSANLAYGIEAGQISLDADNGGVAARFTAPYEGTFDVLLQMGGTTANAGGGYGNVGVAQTGLRLDGVENAGFTYDAGTNVRTWSLTSLQLDAGDTVEAYVNFVGAGGNLQTKFNVVGSPVPEPATMAALGLGALALLRRRARRS